jgi:hypothetical protein
VNLIDADARARAAAAIRTGVSISLARPLRAEPGGTEERPGFAHEMGYRTTPDGMGWASDHLVLDAHGLMNTHIDGLNHVAVNGTFYGERAVEDLLQGSVDVLAGDGLVARAVYVDIPRLRGTEWAQSPVTATDIDGALAAAGVELHSGDALCLDMGRDKFEAAVGYPLGGPESEHDAGGGLSSDGARWVAEHRVSMLVWDMLDSREAKASHASAHILTWAIGLLLVDNCDFAALRRALGGTQEAGALIVAPLAVPGGNGVNVNPLIVR